MEEIFALSPFVTPVSECSSMEGNKKPSPTKTLAEYPTKKKKRGQSLKRKKRKNEKKRKVDVLEVMGVRISKRNKKEGGGANANQRHDESNIKGGKPVTYFYKPLHPSYSRHYSR